MQRCLDTVAGTEACPRDRAGRDGEPARDEPRHPAGHPSRPSRSASRGERRRLDVGPLQRRAVRRHGRRRLRRGDDPRRRRRRSRIASAASPTSGPGRKNLRAKPFKAKIAIDGASRGTTARRAASSSATSGTCSAASRSSSDASPTTASSSIGVVTADGAGRLGAARSRAPRPATPSQLAVRAASRRRGASQGQARPQGAATSSTAATARRCERSRCKVEPKAVTICVPPVVAAIRMPR